MGQDGWPRLVVRPLRESIPLALSLVRSRFDAPSRHAQRFVRVLKEYAGTRAGLGPDPGGSGGVDPGIA